MIKSKMWCDVKESDEFTAEMFHDVDMSYSDSGDTQRAFHSKEFGSITVLNRMTGFGWRDIETGYTDLNGEFWLASGGYNIIDINPTTIGDAIKMIKGNANNCIGEEKPHPSRLELEKEWHEAVERNIKYTTALQKILGCSGLVSGCLTTTRDIARKALEEDK